MTAVAHDYSPGQIWSFRQAEGQPDATLTVLRVEYLAEVGEVVHISVSAIRVPTGTTRVGHLPMTRAALDRSVLAQVGRTEEAPELGGYHAWKDAEGGVFNDSVDAALAFVRATIQQHGP